MSATDFSAIEFTPGTEWTEEDEAIYQASDMSPLKTYFALDSWDELSPEEKSLCKVYLKALRKSTTVPAALILAINDIHQRHPDFHIGHIPGEPA